MNKYVLRNGQSRSKKLTLLLQVEKLQLSEGGGQGTGLRATVLYDYEAAEDNEINLVEGQILTNVEMIDEGMVVSPRICSPLIIAAI